MAETHGDSILEALSKLRRRRQEIGEEMARLEEVEGALNADISKLEMALSVMARHNPQLQIPNENGGGNLNEELLAMIESGALGDMFDWREAVDEAARTKPWLLREYERRSFGPSLHYLFKAGHLERIAPGKPGPGGFPSRYRLRVTDSVNEMEDEPT